MSSLNLLNSQRRTATGHSNPNRFSLSPLASSVFFNHSLPHANQFHSQKQPQSQDPLQHQQMTSFLNTTAQPYPTEQNQNPMFNLSYNPATSKEFNGPLLTQNNHRISSQQINLHQHNSNHTHPQELIRPPRYHRQLQHHHQHERQPSLQTVQQRHQQPSHQTNTTSSSHRIPHHHAAQQHNSYPDPSVLNDSFSQVNMNEPSQHPAPVADPLSNSITHQQQTSSFFVNSTNSFSNQDLNSVTGSLDHTQHSSYENVSLPEPSPSMISAVPTIPFSVVSTVTPDRSQKQSTMQMNFAEVALNPIDESTLASNGFLHTTGFPPGEVQTLQPPLIQQPNSFHQQAQQQAIPPIRSLSMPSSHRSGHDQHQASFTSIAPEHTFPNLQSTSITHQLPPPIYPPHVASEIVPPSPQHHYPSQVMLPNPSAIQTNINIGTNHVTHQPPVYPTTLQQKQDILAMNVFQQSVEPHVPQPTTPIAAVPLPPSVPHHQIGTLPGMSMADMVNPVPLSGVSQEMLESFMGVGRACRTIGRYDLAADAFRACMSLCPESAEAAMLYQSSCRWNGVDTSRPDFLRGTDTSHVFAEDVFNDIGNALRSLGRTNEAEMAYRAALNIAPRHALAWNNLGNAIRARGAFVDAMSCYSASLTYQPGFAAAHCNLAGVLRDQGKPQEAEEQYRAALITNPNLAEAAAGLGTALRDMGRTDEAVTYYVRAVTLQPDAADHHANLANTYKDLNRIEESIVSYQAALALKPDMPDAFCNMVHSLSVICDWTNRSQNFFTLLNIIDKQLDTLLRQPGTTSRLYNTLVGALSNSTPQLVDAFGGSRSDRDNASISTSGVKEENSVDVLHRRRYVHHPSSPTVVKKARKTSKFSKFMTNTSSVVAPVISSGLPSVQPFHALIYPMSPEKFKALAAAYASRAESMVAGIPVVTQRWTLPRGPRARLKVGYVSSDYNNHPYSHLTQSIYGLHGNGTSVECYCYALTPSDQSAWRLRIERESEHFRDISGLSAKQSAETIANDGIHVLVNCNGYTKGARTELFALRPAPVQVSFMGFPGTLGAHYIEYFITDVVTSPPELSNRMHSEALLYHPHSYFVNDHRQTSIPGPQAHPTRPLTRAHYNLPEDCFLFIMHNQLYKLSPDTFDVWARILKRVPNSKIWLLRFPPSGEQRIRQEAVARGLAADRLVFTDVAGKEEHVARAGLGDLFLDTPTCNAHTTGTDVLWSGCPMITCPGSLFASRVAASLLTAAGVPELIAPDMNAYEDLAVELATNHAKLAGIRARIEASRYTNALFDTERWVRNVEALYWRAWKNFEEGNRPQHIYGQDVYDGSGIVPRGSATSQVNTSNAVEHNNNYHNNNNGYSGTESWHSDSPFNGRLFNPTIMT